MGRPRYRHLTSKVMEDVDAFWDEEGPGNRLQIIDDEGRRSLMVAGVIVSASIAESAGAPPGYWEAMLPEGTPRGALLLGLGGGTIAHLLDRRHPGIPMVGVDADEELVRFAMSRFGLDMPNLHVVIGDAFQYVAGCDDHFDYVAVDIYNGLALQRTVLTKPFLRKLKRLSGHGGEISFNLLKGRRIEQHVARISQILRVYRIDEINKNVVVHCRGS